MTTHQEEDQVHNSEDDEYQSSVESPSDASDSDSGYNNDGGNIDQSEDLSGKEAYTVADRPPEYWAQRKKKFVLDVDPKYAKQRDKSDTYKRFKYLLGVTDLFRHFIGMKAKHDKNIQKLLKHLDSDSNKLSKSQNDINSSSRHHRKTEKEEDAELMADEEE